MGRKVLGDRPLWCKFVTHDGVYCGGGNLMERVMQSLSMGTKYAIKNDLYFNKLKLVQDFFDNKRNLGIMVPWEEDDDEPNLLVKRKERKDEEGSSSMTPVSKIAGKKKGKKKRALKVAKRMSATHKRAKKSEEMRAAGGGEKKK